MKTIKSRYMKSVARALTLCLLAVTFACEKTPDAPPIYTPEYDGPPANITIAELRDKYADQLTASGSTAFIEYEYIIKCVVIGNDETGNIYKQLYVRDDSGAINIGIDQNSMYTDYRVGQTVYLNVHNLYLVNYGGEIQIGYGGTNANRIDWDIFNEKAHKDGYPDKADAQPEVKTFSQLTPADVNKLVRFNDVYFIQGGETSFALTGGFGERPISNGDPENTIIVRTSNFANFSEEILPEDGGDIIAILGRYNGGWQLILRGMDDLLNFGKPKPEPPEKDENLFFEETFGLTWRAENESGTLQKPFTEYVDEDRFVMKSPIVYSLEGPASMNFRVTNSIDNPHLWLPAGNDGRFTIEGINQLMVDNELTFESIVLSYQLASNDASGNTNNIVVRVNGVDNPAQYDYTFTASNQYHECSINIDPDVSTIEFFSPAASNTTGFRLDNIKLTGSTEVVIEI